MILELIPKALYSLPNLKTILFDGHSSVLKKSLVRSIVNKEMYISTALIVYVVRGKQVVQNPDRSKLTIPENHLLFLPKDLYLVSDYVPDDSGQFEAVLFFLNDRIIEKYTDASAGNSKPRPTESPGSLYAIPASQQVLGFIDSLKRVYPNYHEHQALLEIKLLELLHLLAIQDSSHSFFNALINFSRPGGKRDIRAFMEEYYTRNLKLEDYAQLTGRSLSTFIRDFKQTYNTTPNQWIIEKRLEKARQLIASRNLSVTEAAFEVGYENVSYFIRAFRKRYGVTPRQERRLGIT